MTENDLAAIEDRVACRYVFRDEDTGEMWIDGGALQRVDVKTLLAEVRRLQDMYADLVEAAQDIVACGADPVIVARLDACLARIDGRVPARRVRGA